MEIADLKKSQDECMNVLAEIKSLHEKQSEEVKSIKDASGESKTAFEKAVADLDAKMKDGEKKMADFEAAMVRIAKQKEAEAEGISQKQLDWFNTMRKSVNSAKGRQVEPLTADQLVEVKAAMAQYACQGPDSLSTEQKTVINSVIDPQGGYLVIPDRDPSMGAKAFDQYGIMGKVTVKTTASGVYEKNLDWADYDEVDYYHELANSYTEHEPNYKLIRWNATDQIYPVKFTRAELEDAFVNLETDVLSKMRDGANRQSAAQVVLGDGIDRPRGILTYASGTSYDQIEQVTSGTASSIKWDDVLRVLPASLKDGYHDMASFAMRRGTFFDLLTDTDGASQYAIMNQINFFTAEGVAMSILGKPVVWDAAVPAVTDNALSVVFGDFGQAYYFVQRAGFSIIRNDVTDPQNITMYLRRRNDGRLYNGEALKILKIKAS